jgi:pyruvate,orthophosphate dikinase
VKRDPGVTVLIGRGQKPAVQSADEIGAKAANLARMVALGLPVPPAFVLPISLCARISAGDRDAERELDEGLRQGINFLEHETGKRFGDRRRPLVVSVRSGAARAMPGMMATGRRGHHFGCSGWSPGTTGDPRSRGIVVGASSCDAVRASVGIRRRAGQITGDESVANLGDLDGEAMERPRLHIHAVAARRRLARGSDASAHRARTPSMPPDERAPRRIDGCNSSNSCKARP